MQRPTDQERLLLLDAIEKTGKDRLGGIASWNEVRAGLVEEDKIQLDRANEVLRWLMEDGLVETPPGGAVMDTRVTPKGKKELTKLRISVPGA